MSNQAVQVGDVVNFNGGRSTAVVVDVFQGKGGQFEVEVVVDHIRTFIPKSQVEVAR
jgi:hypothetical protein